MEMESWFLLMYICSILWRGVVGWLAITFFSICAIIQLKVRTSQMNLLVKSIELSWKKWMWMVCWVVPWQMSQRSSTPVVRSRCLSFWLYRTFYFSFMFHWWWFSMFSHWVSVSYPGIFFFQCQYKWYQYKQFSGGNGGWRCPANPHWLWWDRRSTT